jgi:hypothetical protein
MKTPRALPTGSRGAPYDTIANRQVLWVRGRPRCRIQMRDYATISRGGSKGAGFGASGCGGLFELPVEQSEVSR